MKRVVRLIIRKLVKTRFTWELLRFFIKVINRFQFEKDLIEIEEARLRQEHEEKNVKALFKSLTVLNGYFKGMKYPAFESHGSSLYPKLLGSYESELSDIIKEICSQEYQDIIDVGCAEGFYAVGLALMSPKSRVYAFDIDHRAIAACKIMAEINGVADRIVYGEHCSDDIIRLFPFKEKGLIISDCEGYEISLFTKDNLASLGKVDILVEMHDGKNERISPYLFKLFESTHSIQLVQSINCLDKAAAYSELRNLTDEEKFICLQERNGIQQWAFFKSKRKKEC